MTVAIGRAPRRTSSDLECREIIIADGLRTFVEVGRALMEIRDGKLYKESAFETFEAYCRRRWDFTRRRADQLIGAAGVVETMIKNNCSQIPTNEAQARALLALPGRDRPRIWEMAVDTAPDGKVTARHVAKIINDQLQRAPSKSLGRPKKAVETGPDPVVEESRDTNHQRFEEFIAACDEFEAGDAVKFIVESCMKRMNRGQLGQLRLTLRMLEKRIIKDGESPSRPNA